MDTPLPVFVLCMLFVIVMHLAFDFISIIRDFGRFALSILLKCRNAHFSFTLFIEFCGSVCRLSNSLQNSKKYFQWHDNSLFFPSSIWTWILQYHLIPSHSLKLETPSVCRLSICKSDRQVNKERCVLICFLLNCSKVWHVPCTANRLCVVCSFKSFCFLLLRFYFPPNIALGSRRLATIVFCLCNCFYRKLIHNLHIATEKNHNLTPFPSKHINIYSIKRPNKKPYGLQFHGLDFFFTDFHRRSDRMVFCKQTHIFPFLLFLQFV